MRALLALTLLALLTALAAGGVALAGSAAPHRTVSRARAAGAHTPILARAQASAAEKTCSSVSGCVQGCAVPVALVKRTPGSATSPCASQPMRSCSEYVASAAPTPKGSIFPALRKAVPKPAASGCEGVVFGERLSPPASETLRRRDHTPPRRGR